MKIEKILLLSKGNVLDSWNNVLLSKEKCFQFRRTNFYVSDLFGITAKYNIFWSFPATVWECTERQTDHLELGSGGPRTRTEEGAVEGHGRARRRGTGARGGGARARAVEAAWGRRGRWCHGRQTDGGARRAAVFDEEEDERIDLRQALEVIYHRELLPVPATNRE